MGCVRPVALPAFEAQLGVTGEVAAVVDHVEDVLLGDDALKRPALTGVVVRAVDVQVVIDTDLDGVALPPKPGFKNTKISINQSFNVNILCGIQYIQNIVLCFFFLTFFAI